MATDDIAKRRAAEPNPELREVLEQANQATVPPVRAKSIRSSREGTNAFLADFPSEEVTSTQNFEIPGPGGPLPVRLYEPSGEGPHPILVFFHGGGWVQCNLDTHDNVCAALTNRAGCLTLSIEYRLAPEHPFPAALEDAYASIEWVVRHGADIGADTGRIAVGGDSSGGNLAAAAALLARERNGPELVHQLLLIPVINYAFETDSYEENAEGYLLTRDAMRYLWEQYLECDIHGYNPFASPLRAESHAALPSATVVTAGFDPLRDEGFAFVEELLADGVSVHHLHYDDMVHGFINRPHLWERGSEALDEAADNLRTVFDTAP